MGATRDEFLKFPRTPHLFSSVGTDDDRHLDLEASRTLLRHPSLVVEEKVDGTNVGIHFATGGRIVLQCRGHEVTSGMHPQFDLFKQWAAVKRDTLATLLGDRYVLYGEWLYAKHNIHYLHLPHYFVAFDVLEKLTGRFLDLESRRRFLQSSGITGVPLIHRGPIETEDPEHLIGPSRFGGHFESPASGEVDDLMEGLYFRTEERGFVTGRAKFVRRVFVEKVSQNEDWRRQSLVPNQLVAGADIWR